MKINAQLPLLFTITMSIKHITIWICDCIWVQDFTDTHLEHDIVKYYKVGYCLGQSVYSWLQQQQQQCHLACVWSASYAKVSTRCRQSRSPRRRSHNLHQTRWASSRSESTPRTVHVPWSTPHGTAQHGTQCSSIHRAHMISCSRISSHALSVVQSLTVHCDIGLSSVGNVSQS